MPPRVSLLQESTTLGTLASQDPWCKRWRPYRRRTARPHPDIAGLLSPVSERGISRLSPVFGGDGFSLIPTMFF